MGPDDLRNLCERHGPALLRGPVTAVALSKRLDDTTLGPLLNQWHQRSAMSRERFEWISDALQSQGRGRLVDDVRFDWLQRTRPAIQSPAQLNAHLDDMRTGALSEDQVLSNLGAALSGACSTLTPEELRLFGREPSTDADDPRSAGPVDAWFRVLSDAMTGSPRRLTPTQFGQILAGDSKASLVEALLRQTPPDTGSHLLNGLSRVLRERAMTPSEWRALVDTTSAPWSDVVKHLQAGNAHRALYRFAGLQRLAQCSEMTVSDPDEIEQLLLRRAVTTNTITSTKTYVMTMTDAPLAQGEASTSLSTHVTQRNSHKETRLSEDGLDSPLPMDSTLRAIGEFPWGDPALGRRTLFATEPRTLLQHAHDNRPAATFVILLANVLLASAALGVGREQALRLLELRADRPHEPETTRSLNAINEKLQPSAGAEKLPEDIGGWFLGLPD
ncbi:hypothetical protein CDL60_14930 [Roseateles noduli]|nr:hypothetical protein CDL60_14930 [Roseateles noduli]